MRHEAKASNKLHRQRDRKTYQGSLSMNGAAVRTLEPQRKVTGHVNTHDEALTTSRLFNRVRINTKAG